MPSYWKWMLNLAVPAMLAVTVHAADIFVPEVETVELLLLRQQSVQHDLKIGKAEAQAIREFTDEQHKKAVRVHKLDAAERDQKFDQMGKENQEFLKKRLTQQQNQRLRQISMQRAGLLWVNQPDVAAKLSLTDKQKQQAQVEMEKARHETDAALAAKAPERHAKLKDLRESSHQRLHNLLTPEQHSKWKEMIGAQFEGELLFEEEHATSK